MSDRHMLDEPPSTAEFLPISAMAARSGLSVSALRFYDGEKVLRPESVAANGYRRYHVDQVRCARLVAGLRRIGVPLADIRAAVDASEDTDFAEFVDALLAEHLRRLEQGLRDAGREVERLRALVHEDGPAHVTADCAAADARRLLTAVRFAAGTDPDFPGLVSVRIEFAPDTITAVATDRYRLAHHHVTARGSAVGAVTAPTGWVDDLITALENSSAEQVRFTLAGDRLTAHLGESSLAVVGVPEVFPDHSPLLRQVAGASTVWSQMHRQTSAAEPSLTLLAGEPPVAVRHEFLLQAIAAAGGDPVLRLDGPIAPLVIRAADGATSMLMPVRQP